LTYLFVGGGLGVLDFFMLTVISVAGAINLIWPHFFNGCDLCRPTDEWLLQAGKWDKVELKAGVGEGKFDTVPHVLGTLTKAE
jgi:hypothetical protein